jgi:hypothetical protein
LNPPLRVAPGGLAGPSFPHEQPVRTMKKLAALTTLALAFAAPWTPVQAQAWPS